MRVLGSLGYWIIFKKLLRVKKKETAGGGLVNRALAMQMGGPGFDPSSHVKKPVRWLQGREWTETGNP